MTTSALRAWSRSMLPLMLTAIVTLLGCSTVDTGRVDAERTQAAPASAPVQQGTAIRDFSAGLRCMDTLLLDYGTHDISVMVEDLVDQAQRSNAGARDLLIAVVSDMTQRSRAIRVVASGKEWGNTLSQLSRVQPAAAVVPQYALRGSLGRRNGDGAAGSDAQARSALELDLTLLTTSDLSVVPGVATHNSALLYRAGRGAESRAEIRKFGVAYGVQAGAGDDPSPAARALVQLSAIELFGRLAKVPYWTCLGVTDASEGVAAEIQDWYDGMAARPVEIIRYFQTQLRARRVYDGPLDGIVNPQLKDAVARYREALGLSREPKLSLDFFRAYLAADHHQTESRLPPNAAVAPASAPSPVVAPSPIAASAAPTTSPPPAAASVAARQPPLTLHIAATNDARQFARGEAVQLMIRPNRNAHVYCYLQDENRKIVRFFPNRFQHDSRVQPDEGLLLPGAMRFELVMNSRGASETVSCFATEGDVLRRLPAPLNAGDFEPLPVATLEQVRSAFAKVADGELAQESFQLRPR